ncbi:MAG: adenylate/guanylate cyclase domain-containing protein [Desulfomonilaceae bacterium]|nr:adenylate/guanylate cyclase domain-containing protein [Desulfomonilaceae bacterium]
MVVCINVGANLVGFFLIQVLLRYAQPVDPLQGMPLPGWKTSAALLAILVPTAVLILLALCSPVNQAIQALKEGKKVPSADYDAARRRAVNLPFYAALMNLVAWIVPAVAFPLAFHFSADLPTINTAISMLYNFTNALMITLLAFVILEYACRRSAIPILFPDGGIHDQRGTIRLTIRGRLMIMYGAICLIPMFQTALMINANASLARTRPDPWETLGNLGFFALILFGFTAVYGFWLATLFSRNLSEPTREIMDVAEKIRAGDYGAQAEVVANDEIGFLGDRVNEMARGLAEREKIREVFNLFTSPEIARQILSDGTAGVGETRVVTLLFADLRGFTRMAEILPPDLVVKSVNRYFSEMSAAIVEHGGIVLQYVGDEIEAVFGAPMDDPDHADKAVAASLEMRSRLAALNDERSLEGLEPLRHGVGVHTGKALAGIVGSKYKISYAMVGDTVNMASRIQEMNKELNSDILISEQTYRALKVPREVSNPFTVSVKGKTQAFNVYRLLS